jgi:proline racemase
MDSEGYLDICGHGSMGTVKVLLKTDMIPMEFQDGLCGVVLDPPAGEVEAGTCAKMALFYEQNRLAPGEFYPYKSLFGTRFYGRIVGETLVGNQRAIIPEITEKAYITGIHQFIADKKDPFKE